MKEAVITAYGQPEVFEIREAEPPEIDDGQVLVENHASSINPIDVLVRSGKLRFASGLSTPKVIGGDFAGTVVRSRSKKWKEGDEVFGMRSALKGGAYAQLVVAKENRLAHKPAHLSLEEAAVLPIAWLTAYQALHSYGKLQPGQQVFVNGCTGGVGSAGVQLGKALGAEVSGTCSAPNLGFAKELGADEVYDYHKIPFDKLSDRYHLVFDAATKLSWGKMKKLGKADARFAITNFHALFIMLAPFSSRKKILNAGAVIDELPQLAQIMEDHALKPYIHKSFSMGELGQAHRYFEENSIRGKVAIRML